jgi:hypothetical protein
MEIDFSQCLWCSGGHLHRKCPKKKNLCQAAAIAPYKKDRNLIFIIPSLQKCKMRTANRPSYENLKTVTKNLAYFWQK